MDLSRTISRGNTDLHYLARCGNKELAPEAKNILMNSTRSDPLLACDTNDNENGNGNGNDTILDNHGNKLLRAAEKMLRSDPSLAYKTNDDGDTPLHVAARLGYLEMAKLLLTYSKNVGVAEEDGKNYTNLVWIVNNLEENTALHEAARNGHENIANLLLEEDSSLALLTNKAGDSPLFLAVDGNFYKVAICILGSSRKCSYMGRNAMTIMHATAIRTQEYKTWFSWLRRRYFGPKAVHSNCCGLDAYDFVDKVLETFGSEILQEQDEFGWLPLHYAAHLGNVKVIKKLLELKNTDFAYIENHEGMSALHTAAMNEQTDVIKILMDKCGKIADLLDKRDRTALHVAVESGKSRVVKTLLNKMSYDIVNRKDKDGNTCLHLAALHGHVKILIMLATHKKVDKKAINNAGMNAVDACELSKELGPLATAVTTKILREKGTLPSLERAVIRATKTTHQNETKVLETCQEKQQRLLSTKDVDKEVSGDIIEKAVIKEAKIARQLKSQRLQMPQENQQKAVDNKKRIAKPQQQPPSKKGSIYSQEDIKTMINVNLVVATIIASVTFSAVVAMPGGYNDDGIAILSRKASFKWFLVFDSLAFGTSSTLIFIHFLVALYSRFVLDSSNTYPLSWVVWLTVASTVSMIVAFVVCIYDVLEDKGLSCYGFGMAGIVASAIVPGTLFLMRRIYCFVDDISFKGLTYSVFYLLTNGRGF